jgi:hypothetical protein
MNAMPNMRNCIPFPCVVLIAALLLLNQALGQQPSGGTPAAQARKPRVLFLTQSKGFVHDSVKRRDGELATAELAMRQLSLDSGAFLLRHSQDASVDMRREDLRDVDIVMFYTSGDIPIANEDLDFFIDTWLKQPRHGVIGIHAATDTLKNEPRYVNMIGGTFDGHPWGANTTVTIAVHEPEHPTMAPFGKELTLKEEIYQYQDWHSDRVRVLMSLDMSKCDLKRPYHVPVAWVRSWGEGKIYVNNLGHRPDTWQNRAFLQSILQAIRWIDGQVEGPSTPNPELSERQQQLAIKAAAP